MGKTMEAGDARPGIIGVDEAGHFLRLSRQVPGDAWEWYCDLWIIDHWSADDHRIHLSELEVSSSPEAA